ncbi:MEDS domain-containing protein [Plantactinospora sp. S1510]|uniref:MEDS domain-containing protein n=1 Tax=Plantactinospora alkalitolerans TaxID=2789879 RepID=A0ABS0H4G4_9ACTN|nr:MEDS domain-containing protein [Plantactinospora alkalitolerans]
MISGSGNAASYGHLCWSYDDPVDFDRRAREFLAEGIAAGERVWFVSTEQPRNATEKMRKVTSLATALDRGTARAVPLASTYGGDTVDPAAQVAVYEAATERALATGHSGLRVVADATSLVRTPARRAAFARYEHLIDRYMRVRPLSAMCGYDRRELGDEAVAELACMHPENNADQALFRLHACDPDEGAAALAGELDKFNLELFSRALDRADLRPVDGELVLSAADLRFIDHHCLTRLRDHAHRLGATAVLRTSRSTAARLVELLALSGIRVEAAR